jgi:hypothetical protein
VEQLEVLAMTDEFYFAFTHTSDDGNWQFSKNYAYGTPWDTILQDFLDYLSGVYGYDLRKKVTVE